MEKFYILSLCFEWKATTLFLEVADSLHLLEFENFHFLFNFCKKGQSKFLGSLADTARPARSLLACSSAALPSSQCQPSHLPMHPPPSHLICFLPFVASVSPALQPSAVNPLPEKLPSVPSISTSASSSTPNRLPLVSALLAQRPRCIFHTFRRSAPCSSHSTTTRFVFTCFSKTICINSILLCHQPIDFITSQSN